MSKYTAPRPPGTRPIFVAVLLISGTLTLSAAAQEPARPAFVVVERLATTGPESIQEDYAKLARDILPKYGGRYLARSRQNALLEGEGKAPCCMALLEFPSLDAARRWYASPENQQASTIRRSGARFRIIAIEGLAEQK
jgi:uncharacterized protein (DUF1330 family)